MLVKLEDDMPKYNNSFGSPAFVEHTIKGSQDRIIGKLRLKPSRVLWKPCGQQSYYNVSLDQFAEWITSSSSGAKRTKS